MLNNQQGEPFLPQLPLNVMHHSAAKHDGESGQKTKPQHNHYMQVLCSTEHHVIFAMYCVFPTATENIPVTQTANPTTVTTTAQTKGNNNAVISKM